MMPRSVPAAVVLFGAAAAVAASPAQAAAGHVPPPAPSVVSTRLVLTMTAAAGWARAVVLECNPPGGGHPAPADACAAVDAAGGDLSALPAGSGTCTFEYAPVTAHASGHWRGEPLSWSETFSNACDLSRATDPVFAF